MDYETLRFNLEDGVATVTLDRPDSMNAYTGQMGEELEDAMEVCDLDGDIRSVILTGAGDAFCAGADLSEGGETFEDDDLASGEYEGTYPMDIRKPVIAAINGHAVGVGITYPMQADVRYVAEDAKLGFVFVRRGVIPELGIHSILPRVVGLSDAADLLYTGRIFSGIEAAEMGLASEALPSDEVLPAAKDLAREITNYSAPVSVATSKRLLWEGLTEELDEIRRREHILLSRLGDQPDSAEGVESFLEERDPEWSMDPSEDMPEWPT